MITTGKELNFPISPMDPVILCFEQVGEYICDIQCKVTEILKKVKNKVELIVVIIPDENHSQFYGKYIHILEFITMNSQLFHFDT